MNSVTELKDESVPAIVAAVQQLAPAAHRQRAALLRLLSPSPLSMIKLFPPETDPLAIEKAALLAVIYDETFTTRPAVARFYTQKMEAVSQGLGISWDDVFEFSRRAFDLRKLLFGS
jgi:hypothetical protein